MYAASHRATDGERHQLLIRWKNSHAYKHKWMHEWINVTSHIEKKKLKNIYQKASLCSFHLDLPNSWIIKT